MTYLFFTILDGRDEAPIYHGPSTADTLLEVRCNIFSDFCTFPPLMNIAMLFSELSSPVKTIGAPHAILKIYRVYPYSRPYIFLELHGERLWLKHHPCCLDHTKGKFIRYMYPICILSVEMLEKSLDLLKIPVKYIFL